jgi:flagellar motor switch protein FliM
MTTATDHQPATTPATARGPLDTDAAGPTQPGEGRRIRPYDFQQQEALDRGRLRRLNPVLEVLAHRIAGALTSLLRQPVRVEVGELDQRRWETYTADLPEPTFLCSATVTPFGGRIVLHLPLEFALTLVELRMGGSGRSGQPQRALTEIEQRLVSEVAQQALGEIVPAFAPVLTLGIGALASVSSSMFLQAVKPTEMCLLIGLRVDLGDVGSFDTSLCLPITVLLPILDALERLDRVESAPDTGETHGNVRQRLLETTVDAAVCFPDIQLPSGDLLTLAPGDVVPLHHPVGSPLLLRVGGVPFCHVVATSRGKRLAGLVVESQED